MKKAKTEEQFEIGRETKLDYAFREVFGHVFIEWASWRYCYAPNNDENAYLFPEDTSSDYVWGLVEKSLKDNVDYVFPEVKDNILDYDPNCLY